MNPNLKATLTLALTTILTGALTYLAAAFEDGVPAGAKLTTAIVGALAAGLGAWLHLQQTPPGQAMGEYKAKLAAKRPTMGGFASVRALALLSALGAAGALGGVVAAQTGCTKQQEQKVVAVIDTALSLADKACVAAELVAPAFGLPAPDVATIQKDCHLEQVASEDIRTFIDAAAPGVERARLSSASRYAAARR